jgi:hypothetical protein
MFSEPDPVSSHSILFTLPKLPTDPNQDLRPNLHLAGFHRGERVLLIPISVKPFFHRSDNTNEISKLGPLSGFPF